MTAHKGKGRTNACRVISPKTSNAQIQLAIVCEVDISKGHQAK